MSLNDKDIPLVLVENKQSNIMTGILSQCSRLLCKGVVLFPEIVQEALLFFIVMIICAGIIISIIIAGIYNYIIPAVILPVIVTVLFIREFHMYKHERKVYIEESLEGDNENDLDELVEVEARRKPTFRSKWGHTKNKYMRRSSVNKNIIAVVSSSVIEYHDEHYMESELSDVLDNEIIPPPPDSSVVKDTPYSDDYVLGDLPMIPYWREKPANLLGIIPRRNVVVGGYSGE